MVEVLQSNQLLLEGNQKILEQFYEELFGRYQTQEHKIQEYRRNTYEKFGDCFRRFRRIGLYRTWPKHRNGQSHDSGEGISGNEDNLNLTDGEPAKEQADYVVKEEGEILEPDVFTFPPMTVKCSDEYNERSWEEKWSKFKALANELDFPLQSSDVPTWSTSCSRSSFGKGNKNMLSSSHNVKAKGKGARSSTFKVFTGNGSLFRGKGASIESGQEISGINKGYMPY